ncbi:16S rRNA (cytidine(1402)-2'-O)-methyltransferase [Mycoplasmopsis pulmonis]|uniref:16S rRNA (cytidine(1402)-2'-O)-methyltransferase n=1 Tax=Mycoplasmopsis pulmonis TaxID=2107 RepID=UPI002ACE9693|nr:16S rRNA (cytidine(1402)-2'-O)-methyltransferase [Mycoplasmopsis pulmonis]MDZ7293747.1 16S rRNA (cytidine(1402)-2'-O)-methyltransferase [Mycoplasmopsis pulmonis]
MAKIYIVGTPIGNLSDITLRALETLKKVDYIACEDTRVSKILLNHYQINKPLFSYHKFNEKAKLNYIFELIELGNDVALISDSGMPVISDPGFLLIREAKKKNIEFEVIPGVSAFTMAFVKSSFPLPFSFLGFLNDKTGKRKNELKKLVAGISYISYVSKYKLIQTLKDLKEVFALNVEVFLTRELTKKFENDYSGTIDEIIEQLGQNIKGEFTLIFFIKQD